MKKLVLFICALLLTAFACIYLCIPSTAVVSRVVVAKCKANAAFLVLCKEDTWNRWWPSGEGGNLVAGGGGGGARTEAGGWLYHYRGVSYRIAQLSYYSVHIPIGTAAGEYDSRLSLIPLGSLDSIYLRWECTVPGGLNPVRRVRQYLASQRIGNDMVEIMGRLSGFLGEKENIYGVNIREGSTTDSTLVTSKAILGAYPSTSDLSRLLYKLRDYLGKGGAKQTGFPMMNVTHLNSRTDSFQLMVAIPVDRSLPGKGDIYFKRLVPGKYLIGEVNGGRDAIDKAMAGFQRYIEDYQRTVMAVPFESLLTDRSREADSGRWQTRIYYPIF